MSEIDRLVQGYVEGHIQRVRVQDGIVAADFKPQVIQLQPARPTRVSYTTLPAPGFLAALEQIAAERDARRLGRNLNT